MTCPLIYAHGRRHSARSLALAPMDEILRALPSATSGKFAVRRRMGPYRDCLVLRLKGVDGVLPGPIAKPGIYDEAIAL
jgi:hypothetical protein